MRVGDPPFAAFEPAFRGQKDEYQNQNAQGVPLPRVSRVIPKEQFFQCVQQQKIARWLF